MSENLTTDRLLQMARGLDEEEERRREQRQQQSQQEEQGGQGITTDDLLDMVKTLPKEENVPELRATTSVSGITGAASKGFRKGIADVLGLPADTAGTLIAEFGEATGIDLEAARDPVGGSRSIRRFFEFIGIPEVEADTMTERVVERTFEEIGANVPVLGGLSAGSRMLRQGGRAQRTAQSLLSGPAGTARTTATETGLAASAGAGAGVARESVGEESQAPAEIIGGLVGTAAPLTVGGAVRRGVRGTEAAVRGLSSEQAERTARTRAARTLQQQTADPDATAQRLQETGALRRSGEPGETTIGQITGEPGLIGLEDTLARQSPELNARIERARTNTNQAIQDLLQPLRPENVGPDTVKDAINRRVTRAVDALDDRIATTQQAIDDMMQNGRMSADEANTVARQHLEQAEQSFRAQADALYSQVDPNGDVTFSTKLLKTVATRIRKQAPKAEDPQDTPGEILRVIKKLGVKAYGRRSGLPRHRIPREIKKLDVEVPFRELRALRSRLNRAIREENAVPAPNRNRIRKLNRLRDATQTTLDELAESDKFPEAARKYREANEYFARGAELFREGAAAKVLRKGQQGIPESATLDQFMTSRRGAKEAARQLSRIFESKQEARRAVEDFSMQRLASLVDPDAKPATNSRRIARWIQQHDPALSQFPEVKKKIQDMKGRQDRLLTFKGRRRRLDDAVQKNIAKLYLDDDPRSAIQRVLRSPNQRKAAMQLRRKVGGDKAAEAGLKRGLWDEFMRRSQSPDQDLMGTPFLQPRPMREFLEENEGAFRALGYTGDDLQKIRDMSDLAEQVRRTRAPNAIRPDLDVDERAFLHKAGSILLSRAYAVGRTFITPEFAAADIGMRLVRDQMERLTKEQTEALLKEALVDPEFAATLLREVPPTRRGAQRILQVIENKLDRPLLTAGRLTATSIDREDQGQQTRSPLTPSAP